MSTTITYKASMVPINSVLNTPIVKFGSKAALINFLESKGVVEGEGNFLTIICQCGKEYIYPDKAAIPDSNLTCTCKRKVIGYG